jgi:hypothetical protein
MPPPSSWIVTRQELVFACGSSIVISTEAAPARREFLEKFDPDPVVVVAEEAMGLLQHRGVHFAADGFTC